MQQRHGNWTHSQLWFGTKLITLLLAKWFMRLQNISKIFKVSSKSVSTKRVTSKGQTHAIRGQKSKSYGPHSPMILFHVSWIRLRLIASTLIFVWVIRYSHLSCSKSRLRHLVLIQSKGPASPRNPSALQSLCYAASAENIKVSHGSLNALDMF